MAENDSFQTSACAPDNFTSSNEPSEAAGWHSPTQGGITTPIAPEGGIPAFPGNMGQGNVNDGISLPIAPEGGIPAFPGNNPCHPCGSCNPCVTFPGAPVFPNPVIPGAPNVRYGQVRFINASTNTFPVSFSIDGTAYASSSQFGNVSHYQEISDGFHTVSVNRTSGMQALLLQQTFPFIAGQKVTMVLMDAREGGLEMIQISDAGCSNLPAGYGCYRVANVSYSGSNFDVRMFNGDTVFWNVSFSQVTSYKRALAGNYTFYLADAGFRSTIRELPVIVIGMAAGNRPASRPLATENVTIQAGQNATTYIMGNTWSSYSLRMVTVYD